MLTTLDVKSQEHGKLARPRLLAAAACLLLLAQAVILFQTRWVEDESWYSDSGGTFAREGRLRLSSFPERDYFSQVDTRPPAMPLSLALSFRLFGMDVWQARLFSLASSVAAVFLVFLLGAELVNAWVGVAAAFLLAADNFVFSAARTARPEAFILVLFTAALYFYVRSRRRNSIPLAMLSGLSVGLAFNFHVNGIGVAAALGVFMLVEFGTSVWRQARVWAVAGVAALMLVPFVLWIGTDPVHYAAFQDLYIKRATAPYAVKLAAEKLRYADFIGFGSQRVNLPLHIPYRIHIALALAAAAAILLAVRRWRPLGLCLCGAVLVNLLWWSSTINKTPRYFADLAPLFALLLASAAYELAGRPRRRLAALAALALLIVTQVAGNVVLLAKYRNADYPAVARELRRLIPPGASAYGAITFWMALNDRVYYSFDRAPFDYSISKLRPEYLILNDRVMVHGVGYGENEYEGLRRDWNAFAHEHAVLMGTVNNGFYGDLEIYRVPEFIPNPSR